MTLPTAAIAGMGFMGRTHLQALRRLGVPVAGAVGLTPEEGVKFAKDNNLEHVYPSFEDLVNDPGVQVVHICTPNYLHYPMAKASLEHGKHVICEKPLAINSNQAAELIRLAEKMNLVSVVNYNLRFYPLCQDAYARVHAGEAGEIYLIQGGYLQDWLYLSSDWNWRLQPEAGGDLRAVADIGTHWMDMITWITGLEVEEVLADLKTFLPIRYRPKKEVETFASKLSKAEDVEAVEIRTEDYASILMSFIGGARAALTVSQVSAGRKNYFWWNIYGSKSSLGWDSENPNLLWRGFREKPNEIILKDPSLMLPEARFASVFPGGHSEGYPDTFYVLFQNVYEAIQACKSVNNGMVPTFTDGYKELLFCEAIQESSRQRSWVKVQRNL